jgi:hypothetical protein
MANHPRKHNAASTGRQVTALYELSGLVPNVVFPTGLLRRGDKLWMYYERRTTASAWPPPGSRTYWPRSSRRRRTTWQVTVPLQGERNAPMPLSHMIWMLVGCVGALLLIFVLPLLAAAMELMQAAWRSFSVPDSPEPAAAAR